MPTFDFQCKACGQTFEYQRPFGSKTVPACPVCKSKRTEKLISPPVIAFRGEGFYKTDSAKSAAKPAKKEEKAAAPAPAEKPAEPPSSQGGLTGKKDSPKPDK